MSDITIKVGDKLLTADGTAIVTGFVFNNHGGLEALKVETPKYQKEKKAKKNNATE